MVGPVFSRLTYLNADCPVPSFFFFYIYISVLSWGRNTRMRIRVKRTESTSKAGGQWFLDFVLIFVLIFARWADRSLCPSSCYKRSITRHLDKSISRYCGDGLPFRRRGLPYPDNVVLYALSSPRVGEIYRRSRISCVWLSHLSVAPVSL